MRTSVFNSKYFFMFFLIFLLNYAGTFSQNIGSTAYIEVNNIYLPFNNRGIIADVNVPPNGSTGQFAGETFLFSSGFWLSGYTEDTLWANGAASASLVEDYIAGTVGMDPNEDKPGLILDETYWCVFNDGLPSGQRRWQSEPQGIEIRQTIFAEASAGISGNVVFIRYRIKKCRSSC